MSQEENDKALEQLADLVKATEQGASEAAALRKRITEQYAREIKSLREELAERDASFDLRWKADMRAIARWREESPVERDLLWPDHADKVVWLMGQLEAKDELIRAALTCILNSGKKCSNDAHRKTVDKLHADVAMQDQVHKAKEAEEAEETADG